MEAKKILKSQILMAALGAALASMIWLAVGLSIVPANASGYVDPPRRRVGACPVAALSGDIEAEPAMPRFCLCTVFWDNPAEEAAEK